MPLAISISNKAKFTNSAKPRLLSDGLVADLRCTLPLLSVRRLNRLEMIPHQKMPAANPDPMRRLGVDNPVVTIQTMSNKFNPTVPVRTLSTTHLADSLTTTSPIV